jgi:hypothetical protein
MIDEHFVENYHPEWGAERRINGLVRELGILSYDDLKRVAQIWRHKVSYLERRLRPSISPNIERIMQHGAITAYRWAVKLTAPEPPKEQAVQGQLFKPRQIWR